ncbi:hypothetical protein ABTN59_20245, partial [Acinetobacter baumannii]
LKNATHPNWNGAVGNPVNRWLTGCSNDDIQLEDDNTMLTPVEDGPAIVACNTCRHSADAREDDAGMRGGARMVDALRTVRESDDRYAGIAVQEMP